jgi:hypothetical protein
LIDCFASESAPLSTTSGGLYRRKQIHNCWHWSPCSSAFRLFHTRFCVFCWTQRVFKDELTFLKPAVIIPRIYSASNWLRLNATWLELCDAHHEISLAATAFPWKAVGNGG